MPVTIGAKLDSDFTDPIGLLGDCHRRIERFLGALVSVSEHPAGEALDQERRNGLEAALRYFRESAPRHMADEEESLFPQLRASGDARAIEALDRLEEDHQAVAAWHAELEGLGGRWLTAGKLKAREFEYFAATIARLQEAYAPHIALEDDEVFPQARNLLTRDQIRIIGEEMARRRGMAASRG